MTRQELRALKRRLPFPGYHVDEVLAAFRLDEDLGRLVLQIAADKGWPQVPAAWLAVLPPKGGRGAEAPRPGDSSGGRSVP